MDTDDLQKALDKFLRINAWTTTMVRNIGMDKKKVLWIQVDEVKRFFGEAFSAKGFFSAFQKEYDKPVHPSRKQLSALIDSIPIDLQKVGRKYECYSIGTKKQWIEWIVKYNELLSGSDDSKKLKERPEVLNIYPCGER
jgi:hypothetical protein